MYALTNCTLYTGSCVLTGYGVVIEGDKMRMLAVPEARDALIFPPSYVLPNVHRDAMHLLGNAVCPVVAADFLNELRLAA